jgi:hypothetical protein
MNTPTKFSPAACDKTKEKRNVVAMLFERYSSIHGLVKRRDSSFVKRHVERLSCPIELHIQTPSDDQRNASVRRDALQLIANWPFPQGEELKSELKELTQAKDTPATEVEMRLIVGTMLGGIPGAQSKITPHYVDAIVSMLAHYDIGSLNNQTFSPAVLVDMIKRVWMSNATFAPTIGEVVEKANEARKSFFAAAYYTQKLLDAYVNAHDIIAATEGIVMPPDKEWN